VLVELHQGFCQTTRYQCDYEGLWKRSLSVEAFLQRIGISDAKHAPFGANARLMRPEDSLLHQFVHNCVHMFNVPLQSIIDAKLIIERWRPDWRQVIERAHLWRVSGGAYLTLKLARSLLAAPVPDHVLKALNPSVKRRIWFSFFVSNKPITAPNDPQGRLTFFRYTGKKRAQQAIIGLPLIDGLVPSVRFAAWYLQQRVLDHWAYLRGTE